MPSVRQQINQSLFLVPKMETSQHNPYELESPGSMNVNKVTMSQYKPSEVFMLQDKSKSILMKGLCLSMCHHNKVNLISQC